MHSIEVGAFRFRVVQLTCVLMRQTLLAEASLALLKEPCSSPQSKFRAPY